MLKYVKIWFYFLKEIFYYAYMLLIDNIHLLVFVFIIPLLVRFGANSAWIDNISWIEIWMYARYIFIAELVMTNWRDKNMIDEIKWWSIVTYLNKPISFIWYYFSQWFFKNLLNILAVWLGSWIIIFFFLWRFPRFWIGKFVLFLLTMWIWICMLSLVSLIIALFAFVLEDSSFIRLLINKLYFIFGWVFFPVDIYPVRMQSIWKFMPFQYYVYGPAKFFTTWDINFLLSYLPYQILRLIILILIVKLIYKKMLRSVEINWW
jgi:ABC-type uncharacterized transport system permease subunit